MQRRKQDSVPTLALDQSSEAKRSQVLFGSRRLRYFFLVAVVAVPAATAPAFLVSSLFVFSGNQIAQEILFDLNDHPVDIALFGDSVIRNYSACEAETDGIDDYLERFSGRSVLSLEHNAYASHQFARFMELFSVTAYKPRVVVIPINMRVFSSGWGDNPAWRFEADMHYVSVLAGDLGAVPKFALARLDASSDRASSYLDSTVEAAGRHYGTLRELYGRAEGMPLDLECRETEEPYREKLSAAFAANYVYELGTDSPLIADIVDAISQAERRGVLPLVYITPINYEDGVRYVDDEFAGILRRNVDVVEDVLTRSGVKYINMAMDLPAGDFADKGCACEHLTARGRKYVARRLAEEIESAVGQ